jgi:hypothetical protein
VRPSGSPLDVQPSTLAADEWPARMDDCPYEPRPGLENVRKLEIVYNRHHPGEASCVVEYVGGRVKVFEVDRYLIERLLEHLEHREA